MAFTQDELRRASNQRARALGSRTGQKTAFLCHSHKDRELAEGLQAKLVEAGLDLYIDWQDVTMPDPPSHYTADRIRRLISAADLFLYLATQNSANSKWCPWELGIADARKSEAGILIVPTRDAVGGEYGNEYINLYRRLDRDSMGLARFYERGSYTAMAVGALG